MQATINCTLTEVFITENDHALRAQWNSFLDEIQPSTFLHSYEWALFEKKMGRKVFAYTLFHESKLIGVSVLTVISARRGKFLVAPHGPLFAKNLDVKIFELAFEKLLHTMKEKARELHCDWVRVSSLFLKDNQAALTIFKKNAWRHAPIHLYSEHAWIVPVIGNTEKDKESMLAGMKKNTRYSIKKALKEGVVVRKVTEMNQQDFEIFWNVYTATAERQHFTPYSRDYLEKEFSIFLQAGKAVLFIGSYKDTPVSVAFIVYEHGSGFYHHGASIATQFPGIPVSELVQWTAIQEAAERGCTHYNFWGVAHETEVKHPWFGLSKFKRGFGGFDEEYIHAQDLPLSWRYWPNFILEYIRKIKRRV